MKLHPLNITGFKGYISWLCCIILFVVHFDAYGGIDNQSDENSTIMLAQTSNSSYEDLGAKMSYRKKIHEILLEMKDNQDKMMKRLLYVSSKAGARRIIGLLNDLVEEQKNLTNTMTEFQTALNKISDDNQKTLVENIAELKAGQQFIHTRIKQLDSNINQIDTLFMDVASKNGNRSILDNISEIKAAQASMIAKLNQGTAGNYHAQFNNLSNQIKSNYYIISVCLFLVLLVISGSLIFILLGYRKIKDTIQYLQSKIDKLSKERSISAQPMEDDDDMLTAEDLSRRAQQIKKKTLMQNWAKRKLEERPPFI